MVLEPEPEPPEGLEAEQRAWRRLPQLLSEREVAACANVWGGAMHSRGGPALAGDRHANSPNANVLEWPTPDDEPFIALRAHPRLVRHIAEQLCRRDPARRYKLDQPPQLVVPAEGWRDQENRHRYTPSADDGLANGLRVIWAIDDCDSLVVASSSRGQQGPDAGVPDAAAPALRAGDALLLDATTPVSLPPTSDYPPRLVEYVYIVAEDVDPALVGLSQSMELDRAAGPM